MLADARALEEGARFSAAVCVVGAGPAGLALADALAQRGVDVVVVESGGALPGPAGSLNAGSVSGWNQDLCASRGRGMGGTATLWNTERQGAVGAKYVPLDAIDLVARAELPHSGWPFAGDALDPWYRAARDLIGLPDGAAAVGPSLPSLPFPSASFTSDVYHWGPAAFFCQTLPERLGRHRQVTLLTDATVTGLSCTGAHVEAVRWTTLDGKHGTITAQRFVLALGAIENARFLLAVGPGPVARHGWLGRGLMEHPVDRSLLLVTRHPALSPRPGRYAADGEGARAALIGRIGCSAELLTGERLWNASLRLYPDREARTRRIAKRLQAALGGRPATTYRVLLDLEQAPHRDNRVTLGAEQDRFGVPVPAVEWRWREVDEENRRRTVAVVQREFARCGAGEVVVRERGVLDPDVHHHAGTTRMHCDPAQGVVDAELKVHGSDNLWVAGASVFPTAGVANPTLTIVALSLRLAAELGRGSRLNGAGVEAASGLGHRASPITFPPSRGL